MSVNIILKVFVLVFLVVVLGILIVMYVVDKVEVKKVR